MSRKYRVLHRMLTTNLLRLPGLLLARLTSPEPPGFWLVNMFFQRLLPTNEEPLGATHFAPQVSGRIEIRRERQPNETDHGGKDQDLSVALLPSPRLQVQRSLWHSLPSQKTCSTRSRKQDELLDEGGMRHLRTSPRRL